MKALVLAASLATLSSTAPAGAVRDEQALQALDSRATSVVADAGRLSSASLTALNPSHWSSGRTEAVGPQERTAELLPEVDAGTLLVALGVLAFALSRPLNRAIHRQERQRRAAALASALGQARR
jgi:hypothetical protein